MKKGLRCLLAVLLVFSILSTIPAAANNGDKHESGGKANDWKSSGRDWKSSGRDWKSPDREFGDRDWNSGDRDDWSSGGKGNDGDVDRNGQGGGKAPLDGGLTLLLAAGVGLGVKKALNRKKAKTQNPDISE
jgi:hypothetical protein